MSYYSSSSSSRQLHYNDRKSHYYDRDQRDRRDPPMFFTYMDNEFNKYVGKRVQLIIKHRHSRLREYIGTFMAFDLDMNVVLADFYQVINYHNEYQRLDVKGLLVVRGSHVLSVKREREEKQLRRYPTPPDGKKKAAKDRHRSKSSGSATRAPVPIVTCPVTPEKTSRPLKLKRTWKPTTPEPNPASFSKHPRTPQTPILLDTPDGSPASITAPESVSDMVRGLKIKEEPQEAGVADVVVKLEQAEEELEDYDLAVQATIKEEPMTFEEFINTSDLHDESASEGEVVD